MRETKEGLEGVPLRVSKVGITFNLRRQTAQDQPDDLYEEYDCMDTVNSISREIERYGFTTCTLEQDDHFLRNIFINKPDFVFNIAEGVGSTRGREAQIPSVLESLGIPYSGSDGVSLSITLDKYLTHKILSSSGVRVPAFYHFASEEDFENSEEIFDFHELCIVKPRWEGSSKGVFKDSLAHNHTEMKDKVRRIWQMYNEPAIVEEFLPGDEITVGVIGNGTQRVIGMMRIVPVDSEDGPFLYSLKHKREWEQMIRYQGPETIEDYVRKNLSDAAKRAFKALDLRDVARIDFRLDANGIPRVIDVNPLPGLSPRYSDLIILNRLSGGQYTEIIRGILRESFHRNNLEWTWN